MHRLFAMFVGYGQGESSAPAKDKGFNISAMDLAVISGGRQRQACRQSQLDSRTQKRVLEFQSTPAYQEFRKNWRSKLAEKVKHG